MSSFFALLNCKYLATTKEGGRGPTFIYFLAPFISDAILTTLCLYKAVSVSRIGQVSNIFHHIIRDGLLYFVVCSFFNLLEAAFFIQPIASIEIINAAAAFSMSSIMCCWCVICLYSYGKFIDNILLD